MEVFRLVRKKYGDPLSGNGAAIKGARWNSKGFEMIYSATNRSLAMAEVAVHFSLATLPGDYLMAVIYIPDDISIYHLRKDELPKSWNIFPHRSETQSIGNSFILNNEFCLLKVPSSVVQGEFNILINPAHTEFSRIKVIGMEPFLFDRRLF
jgi:RES domain-containing protein